MEKLSNEEVARVFAMYIGCDIRHSSDNSDKLLGIGRKGECFVAGGYIDAENAKLLLTPLHKISDEDAIEVAKMYGGVRCLLSDDGFLQIIDTNNAVVKYFIIHHDLPSMLSQFLTKQGYAIKLFIAPNHPANGKTAIELGIATSKE